MAPTQRSLIRLAILTLAVIGLFNFYHGVTTLLSSLPVRKIYSVFSTSYPPKETLENLSMTEEQCQDTFPGLTKEIDDAVARGPFELERARDDYTGLVQGRIENGKVRF